MTLSEFSFQAVYRAYLDCRKTKRNRPDALAFEVRAEENLTDLWQQLVEGAYHPLPSKCFITEKPKLREIIAADFRDRIVHHLLVRFLERRFEPVFIHDSYASRKGKGIHKGMNQLQRFMGKVTLNNRCRAFYLQLDIHNFFMEINKHILYQLVSKRCESQAMRWLSGVIIFHNPADQAIFLSSLWKAAAVPSHKSLFGRDPDLGLPIGNLTSQFFANVYLNELDQFVKHQLKCRFYVRYVDDFVLLHRDIRQLKQWQEKIMAFLKHRLALKLNPDRTRLRPVSNGADFLGYVIRPDYILVRRRVVGNLKEKLGKFRQVLVKSFHDWEYLSYDPDLTRQLFDTLSSYLGHFSHANAHRLIRSIFNSHAWLAQYFFIKEQRLVRRYLPPSGVRLKGQYLFFRRQFPNDLIFFQTGCFYEFYGCQADLSAGLFKLKPAAAKFGFSKRCGFGRNKADVQIRYALDSGYPVTRIVQTGFQARRAAQRRVAGRYLLNTHLIPNEPKKEFM